MGKKAAFLCSVPLRTFPEQMPLLSEGQLSLSNARMISLSYSILFHVNSAEESMASALGQLLSLRAPLQLRVPLDKGVGFRRQWLQAPHRL